MKNIKSNDFELNISVIGLSGSEKVKGVRGVGKSCLCNRLAQPHHYKPKHSSVVSSIDFYGSEMNDCHWLYWGSIEREAHNKKYKFRFIEQTVMLDDISHRPLAIKEEYITRATSTELRGNKPVHIMGPSITKPPSLSGKTSIHIFLLVYDVSEVDGRDPTTQDNIFRQLFDRAIQTKRPVIIVTTKHDQSSTSIVNRLSAIVEKRPYNKYPLVETSTSLDINIVTIFEVAASLYENGIKTLKQRSFNFQEAHAAYKVRLDQCREAVKKVVISVLDSDLWHSSWQELRKLPEIDIWVTNLGLDIVMTTFEDVRMDVRLKRRVKNQQKHKERLINLLEHFNHLLPSTYNDIALVVEILSSDKDFIGHFIPFNKDAEYFEFSEKENLLPLYLLDKNNENNLIFVIKEYIEQNILEDQLFLQLIHDCPGNFRKSTKDIGDELKRYMKHFILDKIIVRTNEKFRKYYLKILENKFLEIIQENPNLFWSQGIFKFIDITPEKPWKINGLPRTKSSNELCHDSTSFLSKMVKEINSNISFSDLTLAEDQEHVRETWICNYLNFLLSPNEFDCVYRNVTQGSCNNTVMNDELSETSLSVENDANNMTHIFYLVVVGDKVMRSQLSDVILSSQSKGTLEICKIHSTNYELQLLDNIDLVKDIVSVLNAKGDRCSSICVLICADNDKFTNIKEMSVFERTSNYKLAKYIVYNVMEELINVAPFERSLEDAKQDSNVIHISTLVSNLRALIEPSIVWVVTVCGDQYDYTTLFNDLIKVLKLHSIPKRINSSFVTIGGYFTSKDIDRHNYRLCFISYHQAIKHLIRSPSPPHIDGMLLISSLDRLASLNTCLGIRKYLPKELKSFCHFMLLGVGFDHSKLLEKASIKSSKLGMKFSCLILNNSRTNTSSLSYDMECELLDFFTNIFKGTAISESVEDVYTKRSSNQNVNQTDEESNNLLQFRCKSCGQCKSNENVNSRFCISGYNHDRIYELNVCDQVLGETNENLFYNVSPEFRFHVAQDTCSKCTEVKCSIHLSSETENHNSQPFRTRIRSQSGPDLRNLSDSNKSSSNNGSITFCSSCGAKLSFSTENSNSRKPLHSKSSLDKEGPSKKIANMIQDIFSPAKKVNDIQSQDQKKSLVRAPSKRRK